MSTDSYLGMDLQSKGGIFGYSFLPVRRELESLQIERNTYDQVRYQFIGA